THARHSTFNKSGFTMIELIGAMIIIAVLTVAGISAISTAIDNSRQTKIQEDLAGFRTILEEFCIENPQYAKANMPSYSHGDNEAHCAEIAQSLNEALGLEIKNNPTAYLHGADGAVTILDVKDAYGTPYVLHMHVMDLDVDRNPATKNSCLSFMIVSAGKNTWTMGMRENGSPAAEACFKTDGDDDAYLLVQYADGRVSSCFVGTKENAICPIEDMAQPAWFGCDTDGKWVSLNYQPQV
ncbi:MAG: type II secretion system protein, partial [Acinetobacter sp.]